MDTIRIHQEPAVSPVNENVLWIIGLVAGIAFIALGVTRDSAVLTAIGFVPAMVSFLYLNSMFWARVFDKTGLDKQYMNPEHWRYWV